MQQESPTSAPSFSSDRTVDELLLPVTAGALQEAALPFAASLAIAWDLPIRLVHVSGSISSEDRELDEIVEGFKTLYPDITVTGAHVYGDDPAIAITEELRPQTLPIVTTEHMDKWRFKESTAEALVSHGGVPMFLLGPNVSVQDTGRDALDGDIVVGLDGSPAAESAIEPALGLARATGRSIWLVTVVPEPDPGGAALNDGPDDEGGPGHYLDGLAGQLGTEVDIGWEVVEGNDPVATLEGLAKRRDAGCFVASTAGRFSQARHSMASITSGLASVSARPVLALKAPVLDQGIIFDR